MSMDAAPKIDQQELSCLEKNTFPLGSYAFLDLSTSSTTSLLARPRAPISLLDSHDDLKFSEFHEVEHARGLKVHSHASEPDGVGGTVKMLMNSELDSTIADDVSEQDSDTKSDAGTYGLLESENADEPDDHVDDAFSEESVKRKLQVLAAMVGIECNEPGLVLGEVVRVLKKLDQKLGICFEGRA